MKKKSRTRKKLSLSTTTLRRLIRGGEGTSPTPTSDECQFTVPSDCPCASNDLCS